MHPPARASIRFEKVAIGILPMIPQTPPPPPPLTHVSLPTAYPVQPKPQFDTMPTFSTLPS